MTEFLTPARAKPLRRLLYVVLGLAAVLLVLGILFLVGGSGRGGVLLVVLAVVYGALAGGSLRAIQAGAPWARRLLLATGVVVIVSSVLTVGIFIGLLTVIAGVGLVALSVAPEREPQ